MPRKQYQYHYIYKTTNILTNKFYIGMHSTNVINDGYIGSGRRLWHSIQKYGKKNHKCEILEFLPNRDLLKNREKEIVNEELINEDLCMNLIMGGGGLNSINCGSEQHIKWCKKGRKKCDDILTKKYGSDFRVELAKRAHASISPEQRKISAKKANQTRLEKYGHAGTMFGKQHTEKAKNKMRIAAKGKHVGEKNSQFGTTWISNPYSKQCIKVNIADKEQYLNNGWINERIINWDSYKNRCSICGQHKKDCTTPNICNNNRQISNLIEFFGFDKKAIGTVKTIDEYNRIVNLLNDEYHNNGLSMEKLAIKYNVPSRQRMNNILKALNIETKRIKRKVNLSGIGTAC